MDAGYALLQQVQALLRGVVHPDMADGFGVVFDGFDLSKQLLGDCSAAHFGEALDLSDAQDRHDAGKDGQVDAGTSGPIAEGEEVVVVVVVVEE